MKPLICPHCGHALEPVVCDDIEVDRCSCCQGIWFDACEAEQLKTVQGSEQLDRGRPVPPDAHHAPRAGARCCPRCQVKMTRILDLDEYSIWYEQCPCCGGTWFDAGEFRQFKENFRDRSLLGRARQLLSRRS